VHGVEADLVAVVELHFVSGGEVGEGGGGAVKLGRSRGVALHAKVLSAPKKIKAAENGGVSPVQQPFNFIVTGGVKFLGG